VKKGTITVIDSVRVPFFFAKEVIEKQLEVSISLLGGKIDCLRNCFSTKNYVTTIYQKPGVFTVPTFHDQETEPLASVFLGESLPLSSLNEYR